MREDILIHSDVYAGLNALDDNSISVAITSPPYWKQRDYKFPGQIGQEETYQEYIGRLLVIFNKLQQKLKKEGIFFLNIGDKYLNQYGKSHLLQIPYQLAYYMVKKGWYLEDIIIWYKPNHMPSPIKDRFTNTYEPVLVFSKCKNNIYQKRRENVVEIPLQQTPWRHTAVYPEELVKEMLSRVRLNEGDFILDPFAGTGTTALVVNQLRASLYNPEVYSIMIEKGDEFIDIISNRAKIKKVIRIKDTPYQWEAVVEQELPKRKPDLILEDKYGEIYIAQDSREFLSVINGLTADEFKKFHREDALYFLGVKKWNLESLYYAHILHKYGYILRNMLVVSKNKKWFPIFMFSYDTTRVAYKFFLDRVRIKPKTVEERDWHNEEFIGMKVRDISGKSSKEGWIAKILERYKDGFPKLVIVRWNKSTSVEFVIHPQKEDFLMEGLKFYCPECGAELIDSYDALGENICNFCGLKLWESIETIPKVEEPEEIVNSIRNLEINNYEIGEIIEMKKFKKKKSSINSKFLNLERINWGASPGARKTMLGEYFTKMRLYRIDQPLVAQYLTILRKSKKMTIQEVINKFPRKYYHTVGHWFRKDFGGSIPIPEDIKLIKEIFKVQSRFLKILERTALKFQTVKISAKGKNPGDYIRYQKLEEIKDFLKSLYLPSSQYLKFVNKSSSFSCFSKEKREYIERC